MMRPHPTDLRVLVIPGRGRTREYSVSRRLAWLLVVLSALLLILLLAMVLTYAGLLRQARELPHTQRELLEANARLVRVHELNTELQGVQEMQERVLTLLGAQAGMSAADGMDAARANGDASGPVLTPPPDRWPLAGDVTDEFMENDPRALEPPHLGIDISAPPGSSVRAAGAGVVQQAGWDDNLGNYVEIRHGFGYVTTYAHCAELMVAVGDHVVAGDSVGTLGGTGQVTAPHLYFEVWRDGRAIDPRLVISGDPETADPTDGQDR